MGIFERMTFPASAIYNIKTDVVVELKGSADVEVVKETTVHYVDVSDMNFEQAKNTIDKLKFKIKTNRKPKLQHSICAFFRKFIEMLGYVC